MKNKRQFRFIEYVNKNTNNNMHPLFKEAFSIVIHQLDRNEGALYRYTHYQQLDIRYFIPCVERTIGGQRHAFPT